jgi:hypothetical protein
VSPQIWNAFTGNQQEAKVWKVENNRTNVALSLPSNGSKIIVFSKSDKKPTASKVAFKGETILDAKTGWYQIRNTKNYPTLSWNNDEFSTSLSGDYTFYQDGNSVIKKTVSIEEVSLQNNWKLAFNKGWDTPEFIEVKELKSLTELKNDAVKHYSGTTTYTKSIDTKETGKSTILDLGEVANIAEVSINGEKVGVKWAPPFQFDITNYIKRGKNELEIKVTNTWRNQLIFDNKRLKGAKKTWTTAPPKKNELELEKSGLIGPVVLKSIF